MNIIYQSTMYYEYKYIQVQCIMNINISKYNVLRI